VGKRCEKCAHKEVAHPHHIQPTPQAHRLTYTRPEYTKPQYASMPYGHSFTMLQYTDDMELTERICIIFADRRISYITRI
jgi:hypothetical protein